MCEGGTELGASRGTHTSGLTGLERNVFVGGGR